MLPAIGFAAAPLFEEEKEPWQAVGPTSDFTRRHLPPGRRSPPSRASARPARRPPTCARAIPADRPAVGIREGDPNEYIAISTRCAHLGCPVRFVQAAGNFICPCHGGVYGFLGEGIGGPPVRPLDRFQTRVTNGQVEVGPRYSVTNSFDPVRARDPGEFTGGVWDYLYPPRPSVPPPP